MAEKQILVKLRARASSLVGKVLDALKQYSGEERGVILETLSARFVQLVLEVNEENRAMALNYIAQSEAFVRASRLRWELPELQTAQQGIRTVSAAPLTETLPPQSKEEAFVDGLGDMFEH